MNEAFISEGLTPDQIPGLNEFLNESPEQINQSILNEASTLTFNKPKSVVECEKIIGQIRHLSTTMKSSPTKTKRIRDLIAEMERKLADQFGFNNVDIDFGNMFNPINIAARLSQFAQNPLGAIINGLFEYNAFTVIDPINNAAKVFSPLDNMVIEHGPTSLRYRNKVGGFVYIYVSPTLVMDPVFSNAEVMSIILHEIGHNFYRGSVLARFLRYSSNILQFVAISVVKVISSVLSFIGDNAPVVKEFFRFIYALNDAIRSGASTINQWLNKNFKSFPAVMGIINGIPMVIAMLISVLSIPVVAFKHIFSSLLAMDGLAEEKFCDDFAAIHGYGVEIATGTTKFRAIPLTTLAVNDENAKIIQDARQKGGKLSTDEQDLLYYSFLEEVSELFMSIAIFYDPHPTNSVRGKHVMETLKRLKSMAKTPTERKSLDDQIKQIAMKSGEGRYTKLSKSKAKQIEEESIYSYLVRNLQIVELLKEVMTDVVTAIWRIPGLRNIGSTNVIDMIKNLK